MLTQEDFEKIRELQTRKLIAPSAVLATKEREVETIMDPNVMLSNTVKKRQEKEERIAHVSWLSEAARRKLVY